MTDGSEPAEPVRRWVARIRKRYAPIWPVLNWGLFAIGALLAVGIIAGVLPYTGIGMGDGASWYYAESPYDWTDRPPGVAEYRYSPAFLWVTEPFRWMSFDLYRVVWTALHLAAIAWLGPWTIVLAFDDVIVGNINTFLAVTTVFAIRRPAVWAFALLTKVTPGAGVLYHAGRREWRAVGVVGTVTLGIVAVGVIVNPDLWAAWFETLSHGQGTYDNVWVGSLWLRLPVAAALCFASARWIWLLPIGMTLAVPGLWPSSFALLAALPRLLRTHRPDPSED